MESDSLITIHSLLGDIYHGLVIILTMILPLLEKAVVPLITVGGTLGGVYWAQKGQRETKEMELQHQKETAEQQSKREILEKIIKSFRQQNEYLELIYTVFKNNFYSKKAGFSECLDFIKQSNITDNSDFYDYTHLYFPEIWQYYTDNLCSHVHIITNQTIAANPSALSDINLNNMISSKQQFDSKVDEFYSMLRKELKTILSQ